MTDSLKQSKSIEDCYYFFYSSCSKGEFCQFRHAEPARNSNSICPSYELNRTCSNSDPYQCPYRHSLYHLQKNRSAIYCYWENNGGCQKPHCPFLHVNSTSTSTSTKSSFENKQSLPLPSSQLPPLDLSISTNHKTHKKQAKLPQQQPRSAPLSTASRKPAPFNTSTNEHKLEEIKIKSFDEIMKEKKAKQADKTEYDIAKSDNLKRKSTNEYSVANESTSSFSKMSKIAEAENINTACGLVEAGKRKDAVEEDELDKELAEIDELLT